MNIEALSAVIFYSSQPTRLAEFYKLHLGIPFALDTPGSIVEHLEADVGDVHFAVLKGRGPDAYGGGISPTFRVRALDRFVDSLRSAGIEPVRKTIDLGEGKRVASFQDPDGNAFNLIEVRG